MNTDELARSGLLLDDGDEFINIIEYELLEFNYRNGACSDGYHLARPSAADCKRIVNRAIDCYEERSRGHVGTSSGCGPLSGAAYWFASSVCEIALWRSMRDCGVGDICHIDARYWAISRSEPISREHVVDSAEALLGLLRNSVVSFEARKCSLSYARAAELSADLISRISGITISEPREAPPASFQSSDATLADARWALCRALEKKWLNAVDAEHGNYGVFPGKRFPSIYQYLSTPADARPRISFIGPSESQRADVAKLESACRAVEATLGIKSLANARDVAGQHCDVSPVTSFSGISVASSAEEDRLIDSLLEEVEKSFQTFKSCCSKVNGSDMLGSFAGRIKCGGSTFRYYDLNTGAYAVRPHTVAPFCGLDADGEETTPYELEYREPGWYSDEQYMGPGWLADDYECDQPDWLKGFYRCASSLFERSMAPDSGLEDEITFLKATNSPIYLRYVEADPMKGIDAFWCGLALVAHEADKRLGVFDQKWGVFRSQMIDSVYAGLAPLSRKMSSSQLTAYSAALDDLLETIGQEFIG